MVVKVSICIPESSGIIFGVMFFFLNSVYIFHAEIGDPASLQWDGETLYLVWCVSGCSDECGTTF